MNVRRWVGGRVKADDVAIITRQLAVLVNAGIPLVEALTALVEQVEHERLKRVLSDGEAAGQRGRLAGRRAGGSTPRSSATST